jgi:hypothetical protein
MSRLGVEMEGPLQVFQGVGFVIGFLVRQAQVVVEIGIIGGFLQGLYE